MTALQREHKEAEAAVDKALQALPDTPEGNKKRDTLFAAYAKGQAERFLAAAELAKADPKSDVGFAALDWLLTSPMAYHVPAGKFAMDLAATHHAANPKIAKAIYMLGSYRPRRGEADVASRALLKAVADKNPDKIARGQAFLGLAVAAQGDFAVAEYNKSADVDRLAAEAEKKFELVLKDYGDCPSLGRADAGTLGELAKASLFDLRHLRIGKVAPDIEGPDLDGIPFKLSDYRGKVVLLVFCGDWCGPCRALYPYERSITERLKEKPFALVGVNSDPDQKAVKKRLAAEKVTSRWFWNGPKGPSGPISMAWNVRGWPAIFVLDHKGAIRHRDIAAQDWDRAIDELLADLEKSRAKTK